MKINIAYFTSTGNTLWLAQKAKKIFANNNHQVELFEVVKSDQKFFYNCDVIGIFYPVWSSNLPDPLRNVISNHTADGNNKKIFLIGNCAQFTGDTGLYWKKVLRNKGFEVFYIDHVEMPLNLNLPGFNFWDIPTGEKKNKILSTAEDRIEDICSNILTFKNREEGKSFYEKLGGYSQRFFYWIENVWKWMFSVDQERCTYCKLCYKICPTKNIVLKNKNKIEFGSNCILCLKCYNLCPENAVLIGKWSKNTNKYQRYKGPCKEIGPVIYRNYVNDE